MRVLVADDHDLVRETIALYLQSEGVEDVCTARSLDEAIAKTRDTGNFDLTLLDYQMPGMNGLAGLARLKEVNNNKPIALLSGNATRTVARDAIAAGAAGFVPKTLAAKDMVTAIRYMADGGTFLPVEFMTADEPKAVANLTPRETDVLHGLYEGKSNKKIGRDLGLQEVTIKLHVKTLCRKLDAKNRTQAAMIARDRNLL